jgi:hypothetical protein
VAEPRAIELPTALLLATAAVACAVAAACAFLLVARVVVEGHGAVALHEEAWAAWCGAAASACATVAALIALTRAAPLRPLALLGCGALAFGWPLTGAPPAAALIATLATGFVVRWGAGGAARRADARATAALAALAFALLAAAFGGAPAADEARADPAPDRPPARAGEAPSVPAGEAPNASSDAPPVGDQAGADSPAAVVRAYYRALDRREFAAAWRILSPAVRDAFGGFERWRAGFASTLSSRPRDLRASSNSVELELVARDRAACGVLVQRFAVRWELDDARATAITARSSAEPVCGPR